MHLYIAAQRAPLPEGKSLSTGYPKMVNFPVISPGQGAHGSPRLGGAAILAVPCTVARMGALMMFSRSDRIGMETIRFDRHGLHENGVGKRCSPVACDHAMPPTGVRPWQHVLHMAISPGVSAPVCRRTSGCGSGPLEASIDKRQLTPRVIYDLALFYGHVRT